RRWVWAMHARPVVSAMAVGHPRHGTRRPPRSRQPGDAGLAFRCMAVGEIREAASNARPRLPGCGSVPHTLGASSWAWPRHTSVTCAGWRRARRPAPLTRTSHDSWDTPTNEKLRYEEAGRPGNLTIDPAR